MGQLVIVFLALVIVTNAKELLPPKIENEKIPENIYVASESPSVTLNCPVSETSTPFTYNWTKIDANEVQMGNYGSLYLENETDIPGQYQCFAENEYGTSISKIINVHKLEINSTDKDKELNALEGSSFNVSCPVPESIPKSLIQWQYEDSQENMFIDGNKTLQIFNISTTQSDTFIICKIKTDNPVTFTIKLSVNESSASTESTKLYVSPKSVKATQGTDQKLFCAYSSDEIQWYIKGIPFTSSDKIETESGGRVLIIKNVTRDDEGQYGCHLQSRNISHTFTLSVETKPRIESLNGTEADDGSVKFTCTSSGFPTPLVTWTFNGKETSDLTKDYKIENSTLTIINVTGRAGLVGCNATNVFGSDYKESILKPRIGPHFTTLDETYEVHEGDSVVIECQADGTPDPTVSIMKSISNTTYGDRIQIAEISLDDAGEFVCTAENRVNTTTRTFNVIVTKRTVISRITHNPKKYLGETVKLKFNVSTDPNTAFNFAWYHKDSPVGNESRYIINNGTLTIKDLTLKDAGKYQLTITNLRSGLSVSQTVELDVKRPDGKKTVITALVLSIIALFFIFVILLTYIKRTNTPSEIENLTNPNDKTFETTQSPSTSHTKDVELVTISEKDATTKDITPVPSHTYINTESPKEVEKPQEKSEEPKVAEEPKTEDPIPTEPIITEEAKPDDDAAEEAKPDDDAAEEAKPDDDAVEEAKPEEIPTEPINTAEEPPEDPVTNNEEIPSPESEDTIE